MGKHVNDPLFLGWWEEERRNRGKKKKEKKIAGAGWLQWEGEDKMGAACYNLSALRSADSCASVSPFAV